LRHRRTQPAPSRAGITIRSCLRPFRIGLTILAAALAALLGASSRGAGATVGGPLPGTVIRDVVVSNTDPTLQLTDSAPDQETSIAVNPENPSEIAVTAFSSAWGLGQAAALFVSSDGGLTWTKARSIPPPIGVAGLGNCPCDQTIDYGRGGVLYGTFLVKDDLAQTSNVVTGSTTDPGTTAGWLWNETPSAQLTNRIVDVADQPQLVVTRDAADPARDRAYVAYDDLDQFDARVAASTAVDPRAPIQPPIDFAADALVGSMLPGAANPGLRIAADPRTGVLWTLYERPAGAGQPKTVTYVLNRSLDGGATWGLNGQPGGLPLGPAVQSKQGVGYKMGTTNALLGGVDAMGVDPTTGDVYVVFGAVTTPTGDNALFIRRIGSDAAGGVTVSPELPVTPPQVTSAGLPAVAVNSEGTVAVMYASFDGFAPSAPTIPIFSMHLARSATGGASFVDETLQSFSSPAPDNLDPRQRVLGDYHQMKAVGATFYGAYSGNGAGFGRSSSNVDPIFFTTTSADVRLTAAPGPPSVQVGEALTSTFTASNAGPSTATDVTLEAPAPIGATLASASASQGACAPAPGGARCTLGTLAVGAAATLTVTVLPTQAGSLTVAPSVSANEFDPAPANNQAQTVTPVVGFADLVVTASGPAAPAPAGGQVPHTVRVVNGGPSPAGAVTATVQVPAGASLVSATPSQGGCSASGSTLTCALGGLASGAAATIRVVVRPAAPGLLRLEASVASDQPDPTPADARAVAATTVVPAADLAVAVLPETLRAIAGGVFDYELVVANDGPGAAPGVRVTSRLPPGAALISARPSQGRCSRSGGRLSCSLGTLRTGRAARIAVRVRPRRPGALPGSARVTSAVPDPTAINDLARYAIAVRPAADLAIEAVPRPVGAGGGLVLRVTNSGPARATGVIVRFRPPPTATVRATPGAGRCRNLAGTLECRVGTLGRGASASVALTAPRGGPLRGVASVAAAEGDPAPADNRLRTAG
jgi:uncharacterized repeat protein (TIGR01451 family)